MTQSNLRIILVLLAVLVLGGVYMYVFKPNMDDKKSIDSEVETLEARYNELKSMEVHRDEYIAQTAEYNEKFEEAISIFPATLDQEISVMFMKGIEKDQGNLQFDINTVGLGREELFYTLGGSPAATDENGQPVAADGDYECYKAAFPIMYNGSYEGIKDLMDYIIAYKYRMNITSITITYDDQEDTYKGTLELDAYCVTGGDREADTVTTDVQNGVENIFLGGEGAAAPASTGANVSASSNDVKITLVNANNDAGDGITVAAAGKTASNGDNKVATVDVNIEEKDGKKVATVSLGGEDLTVDINDSQTSFRIYVGSSKRVDAGDTNGIKLNVSNSTDIAVDVKVDGDDETSPRFNMGSKSGTVRVN